MAGLVAEPVIWRGFADPLACSVPRNHHFNIPFTIFVDAIFTNLFERLFTNVFDVIGAKCASDCVCRAGNAG
jgi:hypothetical protein